jgi:hypothetical protein
MTVLTVGKPVTTNTPRLQVDNTLPVGAHVFRLVVVDDDGLQSDPFDATVRIVEATGPPSGTAPSSFVTPIVPAATPAAPVKPVKPVKPIKPVIPPSGGKPT